MITCAGYQSGTEYLSLEQQPASILDAEKLGIQDQELITVIERIRTANQVPVVYCFRQNSKPSFDLYRVSIAQWFNVEGNRR